MKVAVLSAPGTVGLQEVAPPRPGPGQVLVRMLACALCTYEQRAYLGVQAVRVPFVGGHEMVGVVERVEGEADLAPGDLVAIGPDYCGRCAYCRSGETARCHRTFGMQYYPGLHGPMGLSEYVAVDAHRVFRFTQPLPVEEAVFAEPLSCAIHAARRARLGLGDDVAIIGAGVMGLLNLLVACRLGSRVFVSDLRPERLEKARQLGADVVAGADDAVAAVRRWTDGGGADVVIVAVGSGAVNRQAVEMLRPLGRLVLFASAHPPEPLTLDPNLIHGRELAVLGSVSKNVDDFQTAVKLLAHRTVDVRPLVHAVMPLDEIRRAFALAARPDTYRVVVRFPGDHPGAAVPEEA